MSFVFAGAKVRCLGEFTKWSWFFGIDPYFSFDVQNENPV